MVDEQPQGTTTEQPQAEIQPVTEEQLTADLDAARASGDWKQLAKAAEALVNFQKKREAAELEEKRKVLAEVAGKVEAAIMKALKPLVEGGVLDAADGVFFNYDFGEEKPVTRLMRSAPKAARTSTGGGGGKKFDVSTEDLLSKYGSEEFKDGISFQAAWESNTDKNWRYAIRQKLLKRDGIIQ